MKRSWSCHFHVSFFFFRWLLFIIFARLSEVVIYAHVLFYVFILERRTQLHAGENQGLSLTDSGDPAERKSVSKRMIDTESSKTTIV